jgi:hypothetical protein
LSRKSVLLVAPDLGLVHAADEVRAISLSMDCTPLTGTVTRKDLIDALPAKDWDIVWFATHGSVDGIMLSDGTIVASDLAAVVKNTPAELVVLNTCESRLIGLDLHYELGVDVIATVADINDPTAYQTGVLLARNLASGMSNLDSFERSKPAGARNYHIFSDDSGRNSDNTTILMMNEVMQMWGKRISDQIEGVEQRTARDIEALRKDLSDMRESISKAVSLPPWYRTAFTAAFFMLFVPSLLHYTEVRGVLGIGWQSAIAFTALSYSGSATLWAYMWWGSREDK